MKKLILLLSVLVSAQSFATKITCTSDKYKVEVQSSKKDGQMANYSVDEVQNDGADVTVEKFNVTDRLIDLSLNVDNQQGKIQVVAAKSGDTFKGSIYFGDLTQVADCVKK